MRHAALLLRFVLPVAVACAPAETPACRVNADCASGECDRTSGTCVIPADGGETPSDAGFPDAGPTPDAGATTDAGEPLGCVPDHDGTITRDEVTLRSGLRATFKVATDVTIDLSGGTTHDHWDLTGPYTGDHAVLVELLDPAGAWWADRFPDATYAATLSDDSDLLGVFQATDDALLLLGVVSPDAGVFETRLSYDPPVTVLDFPMRSGTRWTTSTVVSGLSLGVITAYSEDYASAVERAGEVVTPFGTFPALRVKTDLERTVGLLVTTIRTYAFVAECFGTVATATSQNGPADGEFSDAAEIRRLAP